MNVNLGNIVTSLRGLWDDLVESRLWPVAIVLVVALIAVPVVLLKPAKSTPAPPAAPAAAGASSPGVAFQAAVSTDGKKSSQIRKDLRSFKRKNPFTPQGVTIGGGGAAAASGTATPTPSATPSFTGGGSSASGSGSSGSTTTTPITPSAPAATTKTFYYHYTVDVSFGKTGKEDDKTLSDFRSLPGSDNPVIVFMGVKNDGKTAVFLVSAKATTTGDGKCSPSDTQCTFLYMKKGDKQVIETVEADGVTITDYTLKLKGINVKRTTAPEKAAKSSKAHASSADERHANRYRLRRIENTFQVLGL